MGLCKCERRKVTNLFCFECKVNVCEHCMIESHSNCVIQTYLAWLSDSDFDPICKICNSALKGQECVRFTCLHVVHTSCCDNHYGQMPKNTAPAGFKCVYCETKIFPQCKVNTKGKTYSD